MKTLLMKHWDRLRSSFWFLPALMAFGAAALAFATVSADQGAFGRRLASIAWLYTGGAEGASLLLGTVAGSMITIAGTVFSMTLVALSLASSQLGPRLLRVFMRDTANQVVLGTFVSTFVYCLLVLRTIRRGDATEFVPHLSVTVGVLLALVSLAVLIHFIHHVSVSIQADHLIARVGRDLVAGIPKLEGGDEPEAATGTGEAGSAGEPEGCWPVRAAGDGYLQLVDEGTLVELAVAHDVRLGVLRPPGHYFVEGDALMHVFGGTGDKPPAAALAAAFVLGDERSPAQDVEFLLVQLVEIAVRALSPGVNDPFTAMACVDRLASGLCRLAANPPQALRRFDDAGRLRLTAPRPELPDLIATAFDPIRQFGRASAPVLVRMLGAVAAIAAHAVREVDRDALRMQVAMISRAAMALPEEADALAVRRHAQAAMQALAQPPAPPR